jgi:hypothetical protein
MKSIQREWREGKVRPIPGNSPHDRLVSRGILSRSGEFATTPSAPLRIRRQLNQRGPFAFFRHGGIYRSDGGQTKKTFDPSGEPPPVGRPPCPVKDATRELHALLIVRDEFRPAIPRSGCSPALPVSASPADAD